MSDHYIDSLGYYSCRSNFYNRLELQGLSKPESLKGSLLKIQLVHPKLHELGFTYLFLWFNWQPFFIGQNVTALVVVFKHIQVIIERRGLVKSPKKLIEDFLFSKRSFIIIYDSLDMMNWLMKYILKFLSQKDFFFILIIRSTD